MWSLNLPSFSLSVQENPVKVHSLFLFALGGLIPSIGWYGQGASVVDPKEDSYAWQKALTRSLAAQTPQHILFTLAVHYPFGTAGPLPRANGLFKERRKYLIT